jgi:hypothetical protein
MLRDTEFRKWYDAEGKYNDAREADCYDIWKAAWRSALSSPKDCPTPCKCDNQDWCELNDTCSHTARK